MSYVNSKQIGYPLTGSFTGSFTGSLFGTGSQAVSSSYSATASYALSGPLLSGSYILNTTSTQVSSSLAIDGTIGIGQPARPGNNLDIQSSVGGSSFGTSDSTASTVLYLNRSFGTPASPTIPTSTGSIGSINFMMYTGTGSTDTITYRESAKIVGGMDGIPTSSSVPGYLSFRTTPTGSTSSLERLRITSDGSVYMGGTNPLGLASKFFIKLNGGTGGGFVGLQNTNISGFTDLHFYDQSGTLQGTIGFNNSGTTAPNLYVLNSYGGNPISFSVSSSEKLRITSDGNILIGKSTPTVSANSIKLNVVNNSTGNGLVTLQNTSTSGYSSVDMFDDSSVKQFTYGWANSGTGTFPNSVYFNSQGSNNMVFAFSGSVFATLTSNNQLGLLSATPTHTLTLGSTATGLSAYNTSDQTTNYERIVEQWQSNAYTIGSYAGGTGTLRSIVLGVSANTGSTTISNGNARIFTINSSISATAGFYDFNSITSLTPSITTFQGTAIASTGSQNWVSIQPTISQSISGGYSALLVQPYEQAIGSGNRYLINAGTNSALNGAGSFNQLFSVTSNGKTTIGSINNRVSVLAVTPSGSNSSNAAWGSVGPVFSVNAGSIVDTTSSGSVASVTAISSFANATLSASSAVTYSNATLLYLGSLSAGSSASLVNPTSLYVSGSQYTGNVYVANTSGISINNNGAPGSGSKIYVGNATQVSLASSFGIGNGLASTNIAANTYISTTSTGSTTTAGMYIFGTPTLSASNSTTITNGASMYIDGAPIAGGNMVITNPWALYVNTGNISAQASSVLFQRMQLGTSAFSTSTIGTSGNVLNVNALTVSDNITATSGSVVHVAANGIAQTTYTTTGNTNVTYATSSTLYIAGAPIAGTNITMSNPYSLFVNSGTSYMGGSVNMASNLSIGSYSGQSIFYINRTGWNVTAWGTTGVATNVVGNVYKDSTSASGSTVAGVTAFSSFGAPTLSSSLAVSGSSVTYSTASTVYIASAPVAGANAVIQNPYSLFVNTGNSYFGSSVIMGSGARLSLNAASIQGSQFSIAAASIFTTAANYATTIGFGFSIQNNTYVSTSSTGSIALAGVYTFGTPTLSASNATTITTPASVYIDGPPQAGTNMTFGSITHALYVSAGNVYLGPGTTFSNRILNNLNNAFSTTIISVNGSLFSLSSGVITDTSTAVSGTVATYAINGIAQSTIAASSSRVTYTNAATLYIAGAPVGSTNVTMSNSWSLYVNSGSAYFGGSLTVKGQLANVASPLILTSGSGAGTGSIISATGSVNGGVLYVTAGSSPAANSTIVTLTYSSPFPTGSSVLLYPANFATANLTGSATVFASGSTTGFGIFANSSSLASSSLYAWNYAVEGY